MIISILNETIICETNKTRKFHEFITVKCDK